jgi:hypothetical protein
MKPKAKGAFSSFLIELAVYAVLVFGYYFLVLHFLGAWLNDLFEHSRDLYSVLSLAFIVAQGLLLETLTTALLQLIQRERHQK